MNVTPSINKSTAMKFGFAKSSRLVGLVSVTVASVAACSGNDPVSSRPGVHIVSGGSGTDTIEARLSQPLIVELRGDDATPLANNELYFFVDILPAVDRPDGKPGLTLSGAGLTGSNNSYSARTDANGRIQLDVRFGQAVGVAKLTIAAPGAGTSMPQLRTEATYTVNPGKPAFVTLAPRDTVLYPAARLELRQVARDRFRSPTTGAIATSFSATSGAVAASSGVVTARTPGRDTIIARVGAFADTVLLTTLPITGMIATNLPYTTDSTKTGIAVLNLDGSGYREYAKGMSPGPPRFTYDNQSIVAQLLSQGDARLWVVPLDGSAPRRLVTTSTTTATESTPAPSPDGQWIYYCAVVNGQNWQSLFRARVNGTSVERLPDPTPIFLNDFICANHSVSADGLWYAWQAPGDGRMKTRAIQTGQRTTLNREGYTPQFAPTGTRIAYIKGNPGPLYTADLDGSNDRLVAPGNFNGPLSWSADGKYIFTYAGPVFVQNSHYELIEEATGKRFPLPFNLGLNGVLRPK